MTAQRYAVIVAYDIACNRRRRSVRNTLSEWRIAGQKSVHICWITRSKAESLFVELCSKIDPDEDKLLIAFSRDVVFQTEATDGLHSLITQS